MDIYIPDVYSENFKINASSAEISIDSLTLKDFILKTTGDFKVNNIKSQDATLTTSSGKLTIEDLESNNLKVVSTSGDLYITSLDTGSSTFKTSSGKINISGSSNTMSSKSTSGDFHANYLSTEKAVFNVSSGDVNIKEFTGDLDFIGTSGDLDVIFIKFANDININTSSGRSNITLSENRNSILILILHQVISEVIFQLL